LHYDGWHQTEVKATFFQGLKLVDHPQISVYISATPQGEIKGFSCFFTENNDFLGPWYLKE
tara:strand:+ start:570 stop:752 length:183 start_codon:yes stop_codon:yes gene_type:complete